MLLEALIIVLCIIASSLALLCLIGVWLALEIRACRKGRFLAALLALGEAQAAWGQAKEQMGPPRPVELHRLLTPRDAQTLALADLKTLPAAQRIFTRYIWIQEPSAEAVKSISSTLNHVSRSATIFRPVPLAGNRLVRVDLQLLTFDVDKDLQEIIDEWEKLRFDTAFSLLLTKDEIKVVLGLPEEQQPMARVRGDKGFSDIAFKDLDPNSDVIRLNAGHLDPLVAIQLQNETLSFAPIVSREYFEARALTTIKDKGIFSVVFAGQYYEFKGLKTAADSKKAEAKATDIDVFFEFLGVGDGTAGSAQKIFDKRRSEQRTAMFRSDVTGKPRQIDWLPTLNRRIGDGPNGVAITHDVRDQDVDSTQHAIRTLRKSQFKDFAREAIFVGANGLNGFILFDGQGKRADEVPPDVAIDRTIPGPHTARLQPAASCIRCHNGDAAASGWKQGRNDVMTLLEKGLDVFGDVSDPNRSIFATLQEVGTQFKGRPDKFIQQARFGYQAAMLEATGPWEKSPPTAIVTKAAKEFEKSNSTWTYERVTPAMALREIGFNAVPEKEALGFLKRLLKPDPSSAAFGILPEDPVIFAMANDIPVYRKDWFFRRPYAQARAQAELARMKVQEKKP